MCAIPFTHFFRKPTKAAQYTGEKLKRLLAQRWTGHLSTVSVIVKSGDRITETLREIESTHSYSTDVRLEATGLLKATTEPSFGFIAYLSHKILGLLDPSNKLWQSEAADLYTSVQLVCSTFECIEHLRCDAEFENLWHECEYHQHSCHTNMQTTKTHEQNHAVLCG